jgi:hypothetical protein
MVRLQHLFVEAFSRLVGPHLGRYPNRVRSSESAMVLGQALRFYAHIHH